MTKKEGFNPTLNQKINQWVRSNIKRGVPNGAFCTDVDEPIIGYDDAPCEKVIKGKNDAYIVFGRDRTGSFASGCGGTGLTQCGMIDLVVGRLATVQSARLRRGDQLLDRKQKVSPNFGADAARIYITQKCDNIDEAFGFKKTRGTDSRFKSAIGIKSDHTRIIARESVRIYAGKGRFTNVQSETCANGDPISNATGTIEFIAGNANEDELQPVVLGKKLEQYLLHQNTLIAGILKDIFTINNQLGNINSLMSTLPGAGTIFIKEASKNIEQMSAKLREGFQIRLDEFQYLNQAVIPGKSTFLSSKVFTT